MTDAAPRPTTIRSRSATPFEAELARLDVLLGRLVENDRPTALPFDLPPAPPDTPLSRLARSFQLSAFE